MEEDQQEKKGEENKKKRKSRLQPVIPNRMTWQILERLLKHYHEYQAYVEATGLSELTLDNGFVVNFFDLLQGIDELPPNQKLAIELICLEGRREVDAAFIMGAKYSGKIGHYKRTGLDALCRKKWNVVGERPFPKRMDKNDNPGT
jgi:hypothetical protein